MPQLTPEPIFLTSLEAAKIMGCHHNTLKNRVRAGTCIPMPEGSTLGGRFIWRGDKVRRAAEILTTANP